MEEISYVDKLQEEFLRTLITLGQLHKQTRILDRYILENERRIESLGELLNQAGVDWTQLLKRPDLVPQDIRFVNMYLKDAVYEVLQEAGRPLHVKKIVQLLEQGGMSLEAAKPAVSIASVLSKDKEAFERVAPNTYRIRPVPEPSQQLSLELPTRRERR